MTLGIRFLNRLENSFEFFIEQLWKDRQLDRYHPIGDIERDVCDWFQNGPNPQVDLLARGWGKTYMLSAGGTCWDLLRDPDWKQLIVSKSIREARKTLRIIREWIDVVPFLQHLRPDRRPFDRLAARDTTEYFDVGPARAARDPSVAVMGIEGQLPGTRANRVIGDDVETLQNTQTLEAREELRRKVKEFRAIASYGDMLINYVGTFHHEESLYLNLKDLGYTLRTWPLLYPEPGDKIEGLAPIVQAKLDSGEATSGWTVQPHYYSDQRVAELQAEGRTWFAMQCQLIANLGDALRYPLRLSDLTIFNMHRDRAPVSIVWGTNNGQGMSTRLDIPSLGFGTDCLYAPIMFDDIWQPYTGTKMWIDPSGAGKDETAYGIVAHGSGMLWGKGVGGMAGGEGESGYSPATMNRLAFTARQHGVQEIYVEDNFGQGMFRELFEPVLVRHFLEPHQEEGFPEGWRCSIEGVRLTGQKELRIIAALEGPMNQHRLVVDRAVAEDQVLQRQLTRLTKQRNSLPTDDRIESLAMAVYVWQDVLSQDPDKAAERNRQRDIDEQLQEHYRCLAMAASVDRSEQGWINH